MAGLKSEIPCICWALNEMAVQAHTLVSSHKPSESGLHVHLHPLVLLTVSDHITRHILRRRHDPIVGALLGRQLGREISLEFAFECDVIHGNGDNYRLNDSWFRDRLQQYKDVHKVPPLELMGWFTTAQVTGPEAQHVPIHEQILQDYNETAVLLTFHPSAISEGANTGGKLPLTIYESVYESVKAEGQNVGQNDGAMEIEGQDVSADSQPEIRFRELPYSIETGEAEMIGVDFVARGGGSATAGDVDSKSSKVQVSQDPSNSFGADRKVGGKRVDGVVDEAGALSPEDQERGYIQFPNDPWLIYNSHLLAYCSSECSQDAAYPHRNAQNLLNEPSALLFDDAEPTRTFLGSSQLSL